ncbi:polymorphic toxin-type HINT domain-containing protein [Streptomyces sp. ID05-39B]|uniref:RHS repeat-associated core domain-containing protein n=1 Tax=Streptomyces sp. ID05-39B TaxID=3028664 RepID=UPI0029B23678|nr:RHS repeat-associated core domain-containing protein [Streptomyces sp. ID05-39B]MDX3530059.1 polymorphic toxin-type HINT domain-containing protein [Streptomyces sp. ID05-39B]
MPLGLTPVAAADGAKGGLGRPQPPAQRVSKVKPVTGLGAKAARERVTNEQRGNAAQARRGVTEQKQGDAWPKADSVDLTLGGSSIAASPGGLPVTLTPVQGKDALAKGTDATVTVLDQGVADRLGITGVVLTAGAEVAGKARIGVDYEAFASAVGGSWSGRLQLVRLPECALTTPDKAQCRVQTPLGSHNDAAERAVSAEVALPARTGGPSPQLGSASGSAVMALTASGGGQSAKGTGDYSATPLTSSSSWAAGSSSGAFAWTYNLSMPPAAAGPAPTPSISYDSGSVDGRTATTNNQPTSVGEGFTLTESYIERSYRSCDDDGQKDISDRCWAYDNARLVLNGKSSRLVKTSTADVWKLENDDSSTVTRLTGATNGDDNGEYWKVVTSDGTTYVFGQDKLDGATTQRTNSTWTVPVFGDDQGEPGYTAGSTFAERAVTQAWRWNLDSVVDTRGNASTYWYDKDTNYYKKNKATKADAEYVRSGRLKEITYGLRKGELFTDKADAKVTFDYAERCTAADCTSLTKDTADNWPDVPFDAICAKDSTECLTQSPSFFTRKRLTGVNTFSWNAATSAYDPVDTWAFTQQFLDGGDIGDTSDQVLTLQSIKRTAKAGTAITAQPLSFTYQMRPNRVDGTDDILPMTRPRISTITSETGAITTVNLSAPECVRSQVLTAPQDTNTRSCYPRFWNVNGAQDASVDWFHKYRVLAVGTTDPAGHNDAVENEYTYSGAAWHYDDDPFVPKAERTWSDWRGHRQVTVYKGSRNAPARSRTVSLYMQGMDGDPNKDGTTKSVSIAPLTEPAIGLAALKDSDEFSGTQLEQVTYDGTTPISATSTAPWSKETVRQTDVPDAGDHVARFVRTKKTASYTYLTASQNWRSTAADTVEFDAEGRPVKVLDTGDAAKSGDETCTQTWYADNDTVGLKNLVSRVRTVALGCTFAETDLKLEAANGTRGNVLSDKATAYDGLTWTPTMQPTTGLPTWVGRAAAYGTAGSVTWEKGTTTAYDVLGRPTKVTNADLKSTTTAYTPATAGPLTRTLQANAVGHQNVTFVDPRRGLPLRIYDANLKKTEIAYDALGRATDVWMPNRDRSSQSPNSKFAYNLSNTGPSWVSSSTLKADGQTYKTSYAIYDSLLRSLQAQQPTPQGGRLLTDTRYDSRGLAHETYADIFDNTSTPNGTYTRAEYGEAPAQTLTTYDGAQRATSSTLLVLGVEKQKTTTTYTGDSVATTAPAGGSAARTITDVRGQTTETRQYAGTSPTDAQYGGMLSTPYAATAFTYTLDGKQQKITGPDGSSWTYAYDLFGRQKNAIDPDKGLTTTDYDLLDRPVKTTTGGKSVSTAYDVIGRPTATWSGERKPENLLTKQTYDATSYKGLPAASTRYVGGETGDAYTKSVTAYDELKRPTATELTLPAGDPITASVPNGKLTYTTTYRIDGTTDTVSAPALGGLPAETVKYGYGDLGQLTSVRGTTDYVQNVDYTALGQVRTLTLGLGGADARKVYVTNTYEQGTGRLTNSNVTDQTHSYMLQDLNYTFDQAGNVTSIADPTSLGGSSRPETQCFAYDGYRRLAEAWTPASKDCATSRDAGQLSGPVPYWTSYTYNTSGQRETETQHATADNSTTRYCYDADEQPHALRFTTARSECGAVDPAKDKVYDYDSAGNTVKRPGDTAQQDLIWSAEGRLTKLAETGKATTQYLYDASGELLIRSTDNGERILYAGATELHLPAGGAAAWAQRTYTAGDAVVAIRSNEQGVNKLSFLAGDHHGTQSLSITADASQTVTKRFMSPFGKDRGGSVGTWGTDKGFLGKTLDKTTGLTHIGARQYDATIGQFISVDPLLETDKAQTLNGYSYGTQNPLTFSDPTGTRLAECTGGWRECGPGTINPGGGTSSSGGGGETASGGGNNSGGTASGDHGGGDKADDDCGWFSLCGVNNAWEDGKEWAVEHREVLAIGTEIAVGSGCAFTAVGAGFVSGGAGFGAVAGCGAISGAAGTAVKSALTPGADDSVTGQLSAQANGAIWGAASNVVGGVAASGVGKLAEKGIARILGKCHSFLPGTKVLMADGKTKDIEDVEVGDTVVTTDVETGDNAENVEKKVLETIRTEDDKDFTEITVATGNSLSSIVATDTHPFWVPDLREWVPAGDLTTGQWLRTSAGVKVQITALHHYTKRQRTHDLTIDDIHAYYVLAGATPVLVHNCGWSELASYRARVGMPARGSADDAFTAARLQIDGQVFFGRNAHGRPVDIRVNAQTKTHAEADVFQQAKNVGATGTRAVLHVDRDFCRSCGATGGVGSLMRGLGVEELLVHSPSGIFTINAVRRPSTPRPLG